MAKILQKTYPFKKAPRIDTGSRVDDEIIQLSQLEFLHELYTNGIHLSKDQHQLLVDNDFIDTIPKKPEYQGKKSPTDQGKHGRDRVFEQRVRAREVKHNQDVILKDVLETEVESKEELKYTAETGIRKSDWMPKSIIHHTDDFVHWVDSINAGFSNRIKFGLFERYKAQSDEWMDGGHSVNDFEEEEERYEYMIRELERCSINSLYAANKYYWIKDEAGDIGKIKYQATEHYEHQAICCYLFDCGYSLIIGKPRQIGLSTIFGVIGMNRVLSRKNYFLKFIAENTTTSEEIFEDKIKFSFYSLDGWFQPSTAGKPDVVNDRDRLFKVGRKGQKGTVAGLNSKIVVTPPYKTAINGGSPPLVYVDEAGSIDMLTEMVNEGRPTMFRRNRITGDFEIKGQLVIWSTGTTSKGGAAFENEWKRITSLWNDRDSSVGFVPIFFDWSARCDEKEYIAQKRYYYGSRAKEEGIDQGTSKIQFHQHYPSSPSDMFATTQKTIIDREDIEKNLKRIYSIDPVHRPQHGYFEPIYDKNKPMPEGSDVPYKIVGANFEPVEETSDLWTSMLFQYPKKKWIDRYFQGTDPIAADTGTSLMASSIWDAHYNTVSCLVNYREPSNPNASFLQCMLAGLFYGTGQGVPELMEKNIGLAYKNYKDTKGYLGNMMYNAELPLHLQSGAGKDIGIDNKGHRNKAIINEMYKVFTIFGEKIYISTPFEQLKTFVCNLTRSGNDTWGPVDSRYYHDDAIWAIVFSYIAAQCYVHRPPKNMEVESKTQRVTYISAYDENWNLIRRPVKSTA